MTRPAFQTYIYALSIKNILPGAQTNSSEFLKEFATIGIITLQITGYICIALHLWKRKLILNFLNECFKCNIDFENENLKRVEIKCIRSMIHVIIYFSPFIIVHFCFIINFNWQGFTFFLFRRVSEVITLAFFSFLYVVIEHIIFLVECLKNQCYRISVISFHDFLKSFNEIGLLIQNFNFNDH